MGPLVTELYVHSRSSIHWALNTRETSRWWPPCWAPAILCLLFLDSPYFPSEGQWSFEEKDNEAPGPQTKSRYWEMTFPAVFNTCASRASLCQMQPAATTGVAIAPCFLPSGLAWIRVDMLRRLSSALKSVVLFHSRSAAREFPLPLLPGREIK